MYDFTHQWQMEVLLDTDLHLDEYVVDREIFVEGRAGSQLKLKLTNSSDETVMFVPSVDGLSIYDEQPASLNSHGIIAAPASETIVDVWAVSREPLTFVGNKTFEKRSGKVTDNVGVFGCLVFRKRLIPEYETADIMKMSSSYSETDVVYAVADDAIPLASMVNNYAMITPLRAANVDKAHYSNVFVKRDANYPDGVMTMYYDSQRGLEKRGVKLKYKTPHVPDAFPVSRGLWNNAN